jgi:hypothetical protein
MRQIYRSTVARRKRCPNCGELYTSDPRTKGTQRYCSKAGCQNKRQRNNERAWRLRNPECVEEQYERSRLWHEARPDYSRKRRSANPGIAQENREQTLVRMQKMRNKKLFDKSKSILTQLAGGKGDKCYLARGSRWLFVRLTKASLLSKPAYMSDNRSRFTRVANRLPKGRLYDLSGIF